MLVKAYAVIRRFNIDTRHSHQLMLTNRLYVDVHYVNVSKF